MLGNGNNGSQGNLILVQKITGKVVSAELVSDGSFEAAKRFKSPEEIKEWDSFKNLSPREKKNLVVVELKGEACDM